MTHRLQHILLLAALLAAAAACTKQGPASGRGPYTESVVHISAIIDDASAATKSTHAFDARYNPNYGILTCVHGTYDRFGERWYNVRANRRTATAGSDPDTYYYPQGWGYNYTLSDGTPETGTTDGSNEFILVERPRASETDPTVTADLYAYAPWNQSVFSLQPTAIPFTRGTDLLYADENRPDYSPSGAGNAGLDPTVGNLSATFTFQHAMARLLFRFKLRNEGSYIVVQSVTIAKTPSAPASVELWESGNFNAVTGTFLDDASKQTAESVSAGLSAEVKSSTGWGSAAALLVPTQITGDDQLTFTFKANGQTLPPYTLKLAHVKHQGEDVYGFQAGYTYTFDFLLDNYLYFNGFNVSTQWNDDVVLGGEGVNI